MIGLGSDKNAKKVTLKSLRLARIIVAYLFLHDIDKFQKEM